MSVPPANECPVFLTGKIFDNKPMVTARCNTAGIHYPDLNEKNNTSSMLTKLKFTPFVYLCELGKVGRTKDI